MLSGAEDGRNKANQRHTLPLRIIYHNDIDFPSVVVRDNMTWMHLEGASKVLKQVIRCY